MALTRAVQLPLLLPVLRNSHCERTELRIPDLDGLAGERQTCSFDAFHAPSIPHLPGVLMGSLSVRHCLHPRHFCNAHAFRPESRRIPQIPSHCLGRFQRRAFCLWWIYVWVGLCCSPSWFGVLMRCVASVLRDVPSRVAVRSRVRRPEPSRL